MRGLSMMRGSMARLTETELVKLVASNDTRKPTTAAAGYGCDVVRMLPDRDYDGPTVRLHARIAFRFADLALRLEAR